jgi:hypothetical protein
MSKKTPTKEIKLKTIEEIDFSDFKDKNQRIKR